MHDVEVIVVENYLAEALLLSCKDLAVATLGVVELVLAVSHEVNGLDFVF